MNRAQMTEQEAEKAFKDDPDNYYYHKYSDGWIQYRYNEVVGNWTGGWRAREEY